MGGASMGYRGLSKGTAAFLAAAALLAAGFAGLVLWNRGRDEALRAELKRQAEKYDAKLEAAEQAEENHRAEVLARLPGLVCWGDELTAGGYPEKLLQKMEADGYYLPVVNMGVGGEDTVAIMARAGALPVVANPFTIPAGTTEALLTIKGEDGSDPDILRQGDGGVNPVEIGGVTGTLSIRQDSPTSPSFDYYSTRAQAGEAVEVERGTPIRLTGAQAYTDYVAVVWMGENGGWDTPEELVAQQQAIADTLQKNAGKVLFLGLVSGDAASRAPLEAAMAEAWGNRFVNLREYLSAEGLADAGLTPTEEDAADMERGAIPASLRTGETQLTDKGYDLVAQLVYERLQQLGFLEK